MFTASFIQQALQVINLLTDKSWAVPDVFLMLDLFNIKGQTIQISDPFADSVSSSSMKLEGG